MAFLCQRELWGVSSPSSLWSKPIKRPKSGWESIDSLCCWMAEADGQNCNFPAAISPRRVCPDAAKTQCYGRATMGLGSPLSRRKQTMSRNWNVRTCAPCKPIQARRQWQPKCSPSLFQTRPEHYLRLGTRKTVASIIGSMSGYQSKRRTTVAERDPNFSSRVFSAGRGDLAHN